MDDAYRFFRSKRSPGDAWTTAVEEQPSAVHGEGPTRVAVQALSALDVLTVHTRNSTYVLVVTDGATRTVSVRGGRFFPDFAEAQVTGGSGGAGALRIGVVQAGLRLELHAAGRRIVTSPVVDLSITRAPGRRH